MLRERERGIQRERIVFVWSVYWLKENWLVMYVDYWQITMVQGFNIFFLFFFVSELINIYRIYRDPD